MACRWRQKALALLAALPALVGCLGSTGNTIVHFQAAAAGPADATTPLVFDSGAGWRISLTKATLHVGAMYLDQSVATSGGGAAPCFLQGTYVAEVTTDPGDVAGIDVDILSPTPQAFPNPGQGTSLPATAGQVWLTGVQVDQPTDLTTILHVEGTAEQGSTSLSFAGNVTISQQNRGKTPTDATKPGSEPLCRQRIVSPIPVALVPRDGGTLLLRFDPRLLFTNVDFSAGADMGGGTQARFLFADDASNPPSSLLYSALHGAGLYTFSWIDAPSP
jgi:hypothetical protein